MAVPQALLDAREEWGEDSEEYQDLLETLEEQKDTLGNYREYPVDIEEFLLGEDYLNLKGIIYDEVLKEMIKIHRGDYVEVLAVGAIGAAKTSIAVWGSVYELYKLSCLISPQRVYGLAPTDEILIICQSVTVTVATKLDYARMKAVVDSCDYFKRTFPYNKNVETEMQFPNRIYVRPVSATDTGAIGQNVIGGIIDELNFMEVTTQSKKSLDGGEYDQAIAAYNAIAKRRKSRYMKKGKTAGMLYLVSSRRYPGQFTDIKEEEAAKEEERDGATTTYVYDKRSWDIKPDSFTDEWFEVFTGDEFTQPYVLYDGDTAPEGKEHLLELIPMEYYPDFESDLMGSIRDIAGVSTMAKHPFMPNTEAVAACFHKDKSVIQSIVSRHDVDFKTTQLSIYKPLFRNKTEPRWCHIDLATTGDSAGVVIGYIPHFVHIDRGDDIAEILPEIHIDLSLEVKPPKGGEIIFAKIRALLYKLKQEGLNIKWVSFDSYQSTDSIQMLSQKGFMTGRQSMDINSKPYDITKSALNDGRVVIPAHPKLQRELISLEQNPKTNKIDHPPNGSKDVADSLAGVVYGLTMRSSIWAQHGVSSAQAHSITPSGELPHMGNMK